MGLEELKLEHSKSTLFLNCMIFFLMYSNSKGGLANWWILQGVGIRGAVVTNRATLSSFILLHNTIIHIILRIIIWTFLLSFGFLCTAAPDQKFKPNNMSDRYILECYTNILN